MLSLLSASATLLEISDGGVADEQEIPATFAPEPTATATELESIQRALQTPDLGVSTVVDEDPPEPHPCDGEELISFDGFPHGTILAEQYAAASVHISAQALNGSPNAAVVFDSGASGTSNPDLEIGIGNLAVIGNGLGGGTQIYTFDQDREVLYVVYVEAGTLSLDEIETFDSDGTEIATSPIPAGGDGLAQTFELGATDVRRLEITYRNSGALAEICLGAPN